MTRLGGRRDPAIRAVLVLAAAASVVAARNDADHGTPTLWSLLGSDRFVDVALLLAAVAGAIVGARLRSQGVVAGWWVAGADRIEVVARALGAALRVAVAVPAVWWLADATTTVVGRGLPGQVGGLASVARLVAVDLLGTAVFASLGLLVGLALGQVGRSVAVVALATLPFAAEGLDLVSAGTGWPTLGSPFGAARAVVLTGTGNELLGYDVDRSLGVAAAGAVLAWAAALVAVVVRVPLVAAPARARGRRTPAVLVALVAVAGLGATGPTAQAPGVPWPLRPAWRHSEAEGTSSRQRSLAWLACRRDERRSCRRFEAAGGLDLPAATRAVLARGRSAEAAPPRFQTAPDVVSALVEVRPERSGGTVVVGAELTLHLVPDGDGGWVVDAVSAVRAVVA